LDLAREKMETAGLLANVQAFHCLDMLDMHSSRTKVLRS
jgi:hypothetical protein